MRTRTDASGADIVDCDRHCVLGLDGQIACDPRADRDLPRVVVDFKGRGIWARQAVGEDVAVNVAVNVAVSVAPNAV